MGLLGTLLPMLPGGVLIAVAVLVWALVVQTTAGWLVLLAVVLLIVAGGAVLKYLTAGREMVSRGGAEQLAAGRRAGGDRGLLPDAGGRPASSVSWSVSAPHGVPPAA